NRHEPQVQLSWSSGVAATCLHAGVPSEKAPVAVLLFGSAAHEKTTKEIRRMKEKNRKALTVGMAVVGALCFTTAAQAADKLFIQAASGHPMLGNVDSWKAIYDKGDFAILDGRTVSMAANKKMTW